MGIGLCFAREIGKILCNLDAEALYRIFQTIFCGGGMMNQFRSMTGSRTFGDTDHW
jgi:hypothetical protein